MSLLYRVWGRVGCYVRLVWLFLTTPHQPLDGDIISLLPRGKGVRRMIARGIAVDEMASAQQKRSTAT